MSVTVSAYCKEKPRKYTNPFLLGQVIQYVQWCCVFSA